MFLYVLIALFLSLIIFARLTCGICKSATCLIGKTAIVTGGNAGIGYQVCLNLASRGCRIIIADKDDSTLTRKEIIKQTGNENIISKIVDLSSFKSIRQFVDDIQKTESRLDILINNAGVGTAPNQLTEDGLNPMLQINYFGPFLLTYLLLDLLKKSKHSRIVFTSSILAFVKSLQYEDIEKQKEKFDAIDKVLLYSISKSATILVVEKFAEKLKGSGVTVYAVHPGWVRTSIFHKLKKTGILEWIIGTLLDVLGLAIGKNVWEGSQTTVHVAIDDRVQNNSGKYFLDCQPFPNLRTTEDGWKIWKLTEDLVQLRDDERI